MAKRMGGSNRAGGYRGRKQRTGGQRAGAPETPGRSSERMRGAGPNSASERSRGGMLAGARSAVETLGESTAEGARRVASGAASAAKGVARGTQAAVDKVRENPWPSLLIGAGVTWLAVDAIRGREPEEPKRGRGSRREEESGPGVVRRAASSIADASRGAGEAVGGFVRERPLLAGAATLGIGMAVGMAFPSTSAEDSAMGRTRDNVVRRAKDVAKGTMDAVKDVAESVERMAGGGERGRERMR